MKALFLAATATLAALGAFATTAGAQTYPAKPVRLVVDRKSTRLNSSH